MAKGTRYAIGQIESATHSNFVEFSDQGHLWVEVVIARHYDTNFRDLAVKALHVSQTLDHDRPWLITVSGQHKELKRLDLDGCY